MAAAGSSSWALAPERGIETPVQREQADFNDEETTFRPALVSDPDLRRSAHSSRYGKKTVVVKKEVLADNDIRPWQEQPTFSPKLPKSELRDQARSSSYGRQSIRVNKPAPEKPKRSTFKPKLDLGESTTQLRQSAVSSGYGKITASPKKAAPKPTHAFRPQLRKDPIRDQVSSSGYGKVTVRPKTAPASTEEGFENRRRISYAFSPRYTLAADKEGSKDQGRPKSPVFILDGVAVAGQLTLPVQIGRPPTGSRPLPPSDVAKKLKDDANSSGYGIVSPQIGHKYEGEQSPQSFRFGNKSLLDEPLEPFPHKTELADQARSSQYGKVLPVQGEKPPPKPDEPRFVPVLKSLGIPDPEPVEKCTLDVPSHNYGKVVPETVPRDQKPPEPVWVPPKAGVGIPEPGPAPRSPLNDQVQGRYGRGYSPEKGPMETVAQQLRRNYTSYPEGQQPDYFHPKLNYGDDEDGEPYESGEEDEDEAASEDEDY